MNKIACVILAAGESSRLGEPKQLLDYGKTNLINHAITVAREAGLVRVIAVTGAFHEEVIKSIQNEVTICYNQHWRDGIGRSIAEGLRCALDKEPLLSAVALMVCDQPHLTANHLASMIAEYRSQNCELLASAYADTLGTPAIVGRNYFSHLLSLTGKEGAKKLFQQFGKDLKSFSFPEGSIDIDTREDYLNLSAEIK